ncbi:excalibur calcium-binding domain-containing protein [Peribacillus sp. AS_2]|uniref:excalibur calcium-binding domain-containing protein n=1 Tax=Peribacillus sp. AS_2 TaxID=2996755 RepID=UPI0022A786C6|nr:excalibur calcium-binding domain-containing protein [Peribacillus sp. AS_2]MCZ0873897.1 excalibur calcium-binding domain-containing protein [Peribacillus sp. AS_2]
MKFIKWFMIAIALLLILSTIIITPFAWIGLIIFLFGIYQMIQHSKGRVTFSKPGWIVVAGFLLSFILAMIFVEPVKETVPKEKKEITHKQEQKEAERLAEEQKKKEEAARLAEEQKKKEEAARLAEEQKKKEEAARLAEEQKKKEEAARLAEEQKKKEEAARLAEEQKKKEEAARLAEEKKEKEEAARLAEEKREQEAVNSVYYKNCDAVRSAGAAPVYEGQPGYSKHLDRDGDGIGCDK